MLFDIYDFSCFRTLLTLLLKCKQGDFRKNKTNIGNRRKYDFTYMNLQMIDSF